MSINREKSLFFWCYFLVGSLANFTLVLFPFFYHSKGMSEGQIALLLSSTYLSSLLQPIFGYVTDITVGAKRMIKIVCIGISGVSVLLFFSNNFITLFILSFVFSMFRNLTFPLLDSLSLAFCKDKNVQYSALRKGSSYGFGLGVFLSIPILLIFGISYVVMFPFLLGIIFLVIVKSLYFDIKSYQGENGLKDYKKNINILLKSKCFLLLIIIHSCLMGMTGLKLSYQSTLLDILGAPVLYMVVLNFFSVLFEVLLMQKSQEVFQKYHVSLVLSVMILVSVGQSILLFFSSSLVLILFSASLQGVCIALYTPNFFSYFSNILPENLSSTGYILNSTAQAITTLVVNSIIIAPLVFAYGIRSSFVIISIIMIIAIIPLYILRRIDKIQNKLMK